MSRSNKGRRGGAASDAKLEDADYAVPSVQRSKLNEYAMQLPTLTANNYHEWKQSLDDLNYFAQWDDSVLDLQDKIETPWDGAEESSDTIAKQRRMAYAVLRMKLHPDLRHLLTGLRPGDSRGIYSRISTRFLSLTTGAIQALAEELNGFTMESSGLPIEKFGYMITQKHRMLLKVNFKKKQANEQTESDAIGFLLNGVLKPEFNSISIYLKMQPQDKLSDYSAVFRQLLNFAADNNLLNLKRGKKLFLAKTSKPQEKCRMYLQGNCKRGAKCKYEHTRGLEGSQKKENKDKPDTKKIICYNCQVEGHKRPQCPKLKSDTASKAAPAAPAEVKQFMIKVTETQTPHQGPGEAPSDAILQINNAEINKRDDLFVLDNACTHHITPWDDMYLPGTIEACSFNLEIGDGTNTTYISKKGQVLLQPLEKELPPFRLANVLHAQSCPYFMLSQRCFDAGGCSINTFQGCVTVSFVGSANTEESAVVLLATLQPRDKLYHDNLKTLRQLG